MSFKMLWKGSTLSLNDIICGSRYTKHNMKKNEKKEKQNKKWSGQGTVMPGSPKVALDNARFPVFNVWRCAMSHEDK